MDDLGTITNLFDFSSFNDDQEIISHLLIPFRNWITISIGFYVCLLILCLLAATRLSLKKRRKARRIIHHKKLLQTTCTFFLLLMLWNINLEFLKIVIIICHFYIFFSIYSMYKKLIRLNGKIK